MQIDFKNFAKANKALCPFPCFHVNSSWLKWICLHNPCQPYLCKQDKLFLTTKWFPVTDMYKDYEMYLAATLGASHSATIAWSESHCLTLCPFLQTVTVSTSRGRVEYSTTHKRDKIKTKQKQETISHTNRWCNRNTQNFWDVCLLVNFPVNWLLSDENTKIVHSSLTSGLLAPVLHENT